MSALEIPGFVRSAAASVGLVGGFLLFAQWVDDPESHAPLSRSWLGWALAFACFAVALKAYGYIHRRKVAA